jgi:hypothetical protein
VNFLATCLGEPEMFEEISENSVRDLWTMMGEESSSPAMASLTKDLVDELDKQQYLKEVSKGLLDQCIAQLNVQPAPNPQSPMFRSIMDNFAPTISSLQTLLRSHKKVCYEIASSSHFLLPESVISSAPINVNQVHPMMLNNPRFVETNGQKGAAFENKTLLGNILRFAPDNRDPQMINMFKDAFKHSRNALEANVNDVRKRSQLIQSTVGDILLTMLKAGGNILSLLLSKLLIFLTFYNRSF